MADLRGGSLVGGFPVVGKNASDNNIGKIKGNIIVNSLLSDDGVKVTSTGEIYVGANKVFHEGNLVASGSATQNFTTKDLTIHGTIMQQTSNTGANIISRNSVSPALYIDQIGTGDIANFRVGTTIKARVDANGDIYVGANKVFHTGNLVASGSAADDFTAKDIFVNGLIQMDGVTIIDAAKNLTNIGTISSGAITSSSSVQGASFKLGATTVMDASRNLLSIGTISSGAITSSSSVQGTSFNVGATNVIDASRNLVNIGTITSGAITSSSAIQGTSYKIGATTIIDASRNFTNVAALTMDGSLRVNSGSIELGSNSIAQTAYLDFNSSATASDYDARIYTTGGTATAGQGSLSIAAASTLISSTLNVSGVTQLNAGGASLRLKATSGDHTYMEFYARTAAQSTRSGFLGFASGATNDITMTNEIATGKIYLTAPKGTYVANSFVIPVGVDKYATA